jgi:two-component system response regulator VicR
VSKIVKILIIEDDENIVDYVKNIFKVGWPEASILTSYNGEKGLELAQSESPDVILLDLGLPDINGFDVLKNLRRFSSVPIIIVSVRGDESSVIKGLNLGADEYIIKPFKQLELLARVRSFARRRQEHLTEDLSIAYGPLRFGSSLRDVICGEREITVTMTEGRILYELVSSKGKVITTSSLARKLWGINNKDISVKNSIRTYIHRLRQKIEDNPKNPTLILTKPYVGYFIGK